MAIWSLVGGGCRRCQISPQNTSPRAAVKTELHVAPCHRDRQEVLAVCVITVQENTVPCVRPKRDLKLSEGEVVLGLQGPGRGSEGSQRLSELRDGQGES